MSRSAASTSAAAVKAYSSPPPEQEVMEPSDDQVNLSDLFSVDDLVDRLVSAVSKCDVAACLFYICQLEMREQAELINQPRVSSRPLFPYQRCPGLTSGTRLLDWLWSPPRFVDEPDGTHDRGGEGINSRRSDPHPHPHPQGRQNAAGRQQDRLARRRTDLGYRPGRGPGSAGLGPR